MTIPRLTERLDCMLYRHKLDLDLNEVCYELQALRVVASDLRSSLKFKKILQVHILYPARR